MDRESIAASITKLNEVKKRLASGKPRPVVEVLDDYDEFRRHASLLDLAGVLEDESYRETRRVIRKFIAQFDTNIEAIVSTRYATARREYEAARSDDGRMRVVRDAADELERLTRYPEHRGHVLLTRILGALREWEGRLAAK